MQNFSSLALKLRENFKVTSGQHFSLLLPYIRACLANIYHRKISKLLHSIGLLMEDNNFI